MEGVQGARTQMATLDPNAEPYLQDAPEKHQPRNKNKQKNEKTRNQSGGLFAH